MCRCGKAPWMVSATSPTTLWRGAPQPSAWIREEGFLGLRHQTHSAPINADAWASLCLLNHTLGLESRKPYFHQTPGDDDASQVHSRSDWPGLRRAMQ